MLTPAQRPAWRQSPSQPWQHKSRRQRNPEGRECDIWSWRRGDLETWWTSSLVIKFCNFVRVLRRRAVGYLCGCEGLYAPRLRCFRALRARAETNVQMRLRCVRLLLQRRVAVRNLRAVRAQARAFLANGGGGHTSNWAVLVRSHLARDNKQLKPSGFSPLSGAAT